MIISKTTKLDIQHEPLDVSCNIVAHGGIPDRQVFDSASGGYTPDYSVDAPLCLYPQCRAFGSNESTPDGGIINSDAKNFSFAWYELVFDKAKNKYVRGEALKSSASYTVVETSADGLIRGMLLVRKNAQPNNPIRLEFEANYTDKANRVLHYLGQKNVTCDDMEAATPVMHLTPTSSIFNPLKENSKVTFEVLITDGNSNITNNKNVLIKWYRKVNVNGTSYDLQEVKASGIDDVEVLELSTKTVTIDGKDVSSPGSKLTIDRSLIGEEIQYVCKAMRRPTLSKSDDFTDRDPSQTVGVRWQLPAIKVTTYGMMDTADEQQETINPSFDIRDVQTQEVYENWADFYNISWQVKNPGEIAFKEVSTEANPSIPFIAGMEVELGVEPKGPKKLVTAGGKQMTIDGKFLVV